MVETSVAKLKPFAELDSLMSSKASKIMEDLGDLDGLSLLIRIASVTEDSLQTLPRIASQPLLSMVSVEKMKTN